MRPTNRRSFRALATLFITSLSIPALADSEVFVKFGAGPTGWKANLDMLMAEIGAAPTSPPEVSTLETIILGELGRIYADFDVTFTTAPPPSPTTIIDFTKGVGTSLMVSGPTLPKGIADTDWLNRQFFPPSRTYQLAEIFPQEFDDVVDEFAGSAPGTRFATMIAQLGVALGGTAAHELGHTYGLYHWDSYGDPAIGPAGYGLLPGESIIFDSMGLQNDHVMATGETGLTEAKRETPRTLSRYSEAKLEIASDPAVTPEALVATPFSHTEETTTSHHVPSLAQPLGGTLLPISGLNAVNVHAAVLGATASGGLTDYYVIRTTAPGLVSAEVVSVGDYAASVETTLRILDTDTFMPIHSADDLSFSGGTPSMIFSTTAPIDTSFFDGMEDDPLLLNMLLPAGDYLIEVSIDPDGEHALPPIVTELFYDLFITSESELVFIPEPATLALLAPAALGWVFRRRAA